MHVPIGHVHARAQMEMASRQYLRHFERNEARTRIHILTLEQFLVYQTLLMPVKPCRRSAFGGYPPVLVYRDFDDLTNARSRALEEKFELSASCGENRGAIGS